VTGDLYPRQAYGKVSLHIRQCHICNRKCKAEKNYHYYIDTSKRGYDDGMQSIVAVDFEDEYYQTVPVKTYEPKFGGDMGKPVR